MKEPDRKARNAQRLTELWPAFAAKVAAIIAAMEKQGFRPRIQDGYRSPAAQLEAFRKGNSKLRYGFHNVTGADGKPESLAVDMLDDDAPLASRSTYLLHLADCAAKVGCRTGILWGLPAAMKARVSKAIAGGEWGASVKIGWDPTHIEPLGITPAEAKVGKRPS